MRLLASFAVRSLVSCLPLVAACAFAEDTGPTPYDEEFPLSTTDPTEGAPPNDSLPDDNKADAHYPAKFEVGFQSPVKSQGSRGVCSMFAATALVENLYMKAGMPVAEADFSEQYLQWASKNLQGAFRNTEGGTSEANLRTIITYGTVKEAVWPYESQPWTAANDPACTGGENLPTKCYTNGEPPAAAATAQKYKIPSSRWINTNSIKAHLTSKGTGVNVGMTVYYQAWNHRRSTLPIDAELWRKGIVTYPNAEDKVKSLEQRAGHAFQIVGWDDDFEAPVRDKDNNPVIGPDGQPLKEKGFYIFKNSWGTASFGVEHPSGPGYGYISYRYVHEYASAVTAELPVLAGANEVCDDAAMTDEDGDGKANCADAQCSAHPSCASGGNTTRTYQAAPSAAIPDDNTTGVSSTITVSETGSVTDVKVTVDISHTYAGDLRVSLVHGSTEKVLSANVGGSADNIEKTFTVTGLGGQRLEGTWTLKVVDSAAQDTGTLNTWSLEVAATN